MKYLTRQEELVLLTVYGMNKASTLKEIREILIRISGKEWSISSVYVPLDRLAAAGMISAGFGRPSAVRGGKARKYFRITPAGIAALKEHKKFTETVWNKAENLKAES